MRKHLLTTVAAMAIATPAFAGDLTGGYAPPSGDPLYRSNTMVAGDLELSLGMGRISVDGLPVDLDWNHFQGWARANVPLGAWNLLVEGGSTAVFGGDIPDGLSFSSTSANLHVWTGSNGLRYGAFGGASFGTGVIATMGSVGVEAEADLGSNVTVGGQGFYSWAEPGGCGGPCDVDAFGIQGWADYYITANTKVTGTASWVNVDAFGGDVDIFGVDGRVTHRFDGMPVNVFGQLGYRNVDVGGGDADVVSGKVGFTVLLDGPGYNQQEFDRSVPFSFKNPLAHAGSL